MSAWLKYFPASEFVRVRMLPSLLISLAIYIIGAAAVHLILGLFSGIFIVGTVVAVLNWLVKVYTVVGIIVSVMKYFDMLK